MTIGVKIKINVKQIEKARLFQGKKGGVYLDATVFIKDEEDQYGNHGMITQDVSKEEKDKGVKGNILGNVKVFWTDAEQPSKQGNQKPRQDQQMPKDDYDGEIPF
jgi:hypothetical protein